MRQSTTLTGFLVAAVLMVPCAIAQTGQDQGSPLDRFEQLSTEARSSFARKSGEAQAAFEKKVRAVWRAWEESTREVWVDYSGEGSTRSSVDFDKGKVVIETLVPVDNKEGRKKAEEALEGRFMELLEEEDSTGKVLSGQIQGKKEAVSKKNAGGFFKEEVKGSIRKGDPVVGEDRVKRQRYRVEISMVPDHLDRRARKYLPIVRECAKATGLPVSLIVAVMHVESSFNPRARSNIRRKGKAVRHAYGLMQVVPQTAGADVYRWLNKKKGKPSAQELYDPEVNIIYGTYYLAYLKEDRFERFKSEQKRTDCAIVSYNAGAGTMSKVLGRGSKLDEMSDEEFRSFCLRNAPNSYLKKVLEKWKLYLAYDG